MTIASAAAKAWNHWLRVTSIPMVQVGPGETIVAVGSGMLIDHAGCRFVLSVEHVVKRNSSGWAIVVQQDDRGKLEYYRPNVFTFVGEGRLSTGETRLLDLCAAQVAPDLRTWYEHRTPRALVDKERHHVFNSADFALPDSRQTYGFSGRVRTEKHGEDAFVSDMVVYPGLTYSHTAGELHHFQLPVDHPGHDAFRGCSGSPILDLNRRVVALVVSGDLDTNTVSGVAIERVLPNLAFLAAQSGA